MVVVPIETLGRAATARQTLPVRDVARGPAFRNAPRTELEINEG
jgi:hypothetical protein